MKKLYLDDVREPGDNTWFVVRNYDEFVSYIEREGIPDTMSLDHDLGEGKNGFDCTRYLLGYIRKKIDNKEALPTKIDYNIHSMNPVGAKNMRDCLEYINLWLELN